MVMAQWLNKVWGVSPQMIAAVSNLSTSRKLKAETNNDAAGSNPTNVRGYELVPLNFSYKVGRAAGCPDPRAEYGSWWSLVGLYAPFYLAGRRFGAPRYLLTEVKPSNIVLGDDGEWIECSIDLTFEEYANEAAGDKGSVTATSVSSATAIGSAASAVSAASAIKIGATTADKATRKVTTL